MKTLLKNNPVKIEFLKNKIYRFLRDRKNENYLLLLFSKYFSWDK